MVKTVFDANPDSVIMEIMSREDRKKYIWKVACKNSRADQVDNDAAYLPIVIHDNVLKSHGMLELDGYRGLLLDRAEGGDLLDSIGKGMSESVVKNIARCMVQALCHVHNCNVIHRDVKPDNILFMRSEDVATGLHCVLSDFGCAGTGICRGQCGSGAYMAPEMYLGKRYNGSVDMWSLGVTLFTCLCAKYPYAKIPESQRMAKVPTIEGVSDECVCFIEDLLQFNPYDRMSAPDALEHEWLL